MNKQESYSQEDNALPGTLFEWDKDSHAPPQHQHRHSLSYIPPSLVEVRFNLLKTEHKI